MAVRTHARVTGIVLLLIGIVLLAVAIMLWGASGLDQGADDLTLLYVAPPLLLGLAAVAGGVVMLRRRSPDA